MKEFIVDPRYYYDIQLIIGETIKRHSSKDIYQNQYTEASSMLKGIKHRNELIYSPNIEEIISRLNGNELWALKLAIDDLISDPSDDIAIDSLRVIYDYLKQFDAAI